MSVQVLKASNPSSVLKSGQRVLSEEADALLKLRDSLGESFTNAVETISQAKGRLVVTGMGKSGHVAKKIAATMASTGTPAFFLHPGEASHGDLGMVKKDDVVLALSFSGSTTELNDIIEYTRRFSIPLIGMTSGTDSVLATRCDIPLLLPKIKEACPNNQAPTTSTTMMIALGDALAVALLEKQNLTADQFRVFHPGGKLGQKLLRIVDIMHALETVPFVKEEATFAEIKQKIASGKLGCVCVSQNEKTLSGIITDGDIRRHGENLTSLQAKDLMTKNPSTLASNALAAEAMGLMNDKQITNLPIVDDGQLVGVLHIHDCLKAAIA